MKLPNLRKIGRYAFCILLVAAIFLLYEFRLFQWQILEGDEFEMQSLNDRTDVIELEGARGPILDRNGKILAGNRTSYDIVFNALYDLRPQRNATILKAVDLLEERGEPWRDVLPIRVDEEGVYQFLEGKEDAVASLKQNLKMADYASAAECMDELCETYGCVGFSTEDARTVASVRYSMTRDGYSRTNPYVFARNVSTDTVGIIGQRPKDFPGVEPRVSVTRYYGEDGTLAPHVVGYVGAISGEEYDRAVENGTAYNSVNNISGYKWTDSLGIDGLEAAFESDLRGFRGEETIYTDETGAIKSTAVTTSPREGNAVYTTLDSDLQRVANLSLKKNIEGNTLAKDCHSGAVVVLDVKDFGVRACSSYPTFDVNSFSEDFEKLANDKNKPLHNNALQGVYTPGSVFKPMVALAALQEQTISATTTWYCDKLYTLGDDEATALKLACTDTHADTNVYGALAGSCNVFFCNVGVNLTIKKMDAYAEYFGLGEKTGVELSESTGTMSNPQEYLENHGTPWLDGVSAQTAIGQADNMFTPIQLATYCATIANGGVRLQTHFLDKVTDYTGEELVRTYEPVKLFDAGLSSDVLGVVREGMMGVASYGTARSVFSEYPISIACKTGTAEIAYDSEDPDATEPNISFICYAPADDPEIAIAVMLEYGNKGPYAQNVAKDILDQYFGFYSWDEEGNRYDASGNLVDDEGQVLKTKEQLDREKEEAEQQKTEDFLNSVQGGEESDPDGDEPEPDPTPAFDRDNIPNAPFTGEPTPSPDPDLPPEPTPSPTPKPDSPYFKPTG